MTEILDQEPEFWLPAEFLTDEDILMENKQNPNHLCFPSEFPFDFTGVTNSGDVQDQLAELTRQLSLCKEGRITTLPYGVVGSPESTLFRFGGYSSRSPGSSNDVSPIGTSQVSSPTSQFTNSGDSLDLIYQAAAQVAKMRMNGGDASFDERRNLLSRPNHSRHALNNSSALYNSFVQRVREEQILKHEEQQRRNVWSNNQSKDGVIFQHQQQNGFSGLNVGAYLENDQSAWPSLQYVMQKNLQIRSGNRAAYQGGGSGSDYFSSARKPSAGTGVFLPRGYGSNIKENHFVGSQTRTNRNTGCSTTSLNGMGERNYPHVNGGGRALPQWQPHRGGVFCSDYEVQLAHKNAMLLHQRSSHLQQVALGHELGLPQEWTY